MTENSATVSASSKSFSDSLVYVAFVLVAVGGFAVHMTLLIMRHTSYPTSITTYINEKAFQYPDITFCNKDPITISKYSTPFDEYHLVAVLNKKAEPIWKLADNLENYLYPETAKNKSKYLIIVIFY